MIKAGLRTPDTMVLFETMGDGLDCASPPTFHPATFYIVAESRGGSGCHGEIYRRLRETVYDSPTPLP